MNHTTGRLSGKKSIRQRDRSQIQPHTALLCNGGARMQYSRVLLDLGRIMGMELSCPGGSRADHTSQAGCFHSNWDKDAPASTLLLLNSIQIKLTIHTKNNELRHPNSALGIISKICHPIYGEKRVKSWMSWSFCRINCMSMFKVIAM